MTDTLTTPDTVPLQPLIPFSDGYVLRFGDHPAKPGAGFVLFDSTQRVFGLVNRLDVAEMICQALKDAARVIIAKDTTIVAPEAKKVIS